MQRINLHLRSDHSRKVRDAIASGVCTRGSHHCHFPSERPTFSSAASCLYNPVTDQSACSFSAPCRPNPQRGATLSPVRHMRAPDRRISIRVATLSKAGQFSPVRGIRAAVRGIILRFPCSDLTVACTATRTRLGRANVTMMSTAWEDSEKRRKSLVLTSVRVFKCRGMSLIPVGGCIHGLASVTDG